MSVLLVCNRPFIPALKKMEPYFYANHLDDPTLFETAYKALYTFLCTIVKGNLDIQIKAIHFEHETNRDVDIRSGSEKLRGSIKNVLESFRALHQRGERLERDFVMNQIANLKIEAEALMKVPIGFRWKCIARCLPCCLS